MRILYRGNFKPSFSTESHIALSLEALDHEVIRSQEDHVSWSDTIKQAKKCDLFLWTCTFGYAHQWDQDEAHRAVLTLNDTLPTLACHLDRFHGLERSQQVQTEPWFRLHTVATADGGHQEEWEKAGVNHVWFPPAVVHTEAEPGEYREEYASDLVFVGSHGNYGHPAWAIKRRRMIYEVRRTYGRKLALWPKPGQGAIRGKELQDLYASVKVAVGDSCLVPAVSGKPCTRYCSDRIPETVGRGAAFVHPWVEGVTDGTLYEDGKHLLTYPLGDWRAMKAQIDRLLEDDVLRKQIATDGHAHVLENHTYKVRMEQLLSKVLPEHCADKHT